jgi:hypothetical protein
MNSSPTTSAPSAEPAVAERRPTPFVIQIVVGDVTHAQASVIAVNHFSGVNPSGAEAAVDRAMNGALGRRAAMGAFDGRFGATYFMPAGSAQLAAASVLILGLGEPENFDEQLLPGLGTAFVEALATFGLRDAATILHGAGSIGIDAERAACLFVGGVLTGLQTIQGAGCFRELSIYEWGVEKVPEIRRGIMTATATPGVHVYLEETTQEVRPDEARRDEARKPTSPTEMPSHLRIYITQRMPEVKVTVIGGEAYDVAGDHEYPDDVVEGLTDRIKDGIILEPETENRRRTLQSIGEQLYNAFLGWTQFGLPERIVEARDGYLVLRLDESTVDLPWELLCLNGEFLSRTHVFARQLEIVGAPGRQAAVVEPHSRLRVLVVGDPTADLPGARREAEALVDKLERHAGANVTALIGKVSYADLSRALDTDQFDVVHYAGHARFDPMRERESGFALTDRTLTAGDLATRPHLPGLFVANACNSAQTGDGLPEDPFAGARETLNVVSGLLSAGVRGFVGSAWKVNDEAATTFATAFYDALLLGSDSAPASIGEAVRRGRLAIVKEHGEGEPAWAGYALYGSPWKAGF